MFKPGFKVLEVSYFGGKAAEGCYQTIINHIPPHDVFISGFLGHCAIMRFKQPAVVNIGIDKDIHIVDAWNKANLPHFSFFAGNALDFLPQLIKRFEGKRIFIYLDPPYPLDSRKNSVEVYKYEMSDGDHLSLLTWAKKQDVMIAISTYDNAMYRLTLDSRKWHKIQFESQTRRGKATETLYMNYPLTGQLHDYSYVGTDYRERERIKKKIKRWVNNLMRLPAHERNAILTAINK